MLFRWTNSSMNRPKHERTDIEISVLSCRQVLLQNLGLDSLLPTSNFFDVRYI